jgi:spectinomycin phosphotransferase
MTELTHFIINCLSAYYWIEVTTLALLPVGGDINASIYKVQASDQKTYFVKLRRGHSHDVNIAILELLQRAGIQQLIPPIKTAEGKQTHQAGDFTLIVYPFVQGQDGFSRSLTDEQWIALGQALRQVHEINVPASIKTRIRREDFSPKWREAVRSLYAHIEETPVGNEVALNLWKFLQKNRSIIQQLVNRSEQLSQKVRGQPLQLVLCHADIHGGNVLVDDKNALYIVDWDDPILAPKERDLMFIGGGVGNVWNKPHEEKLFYQGYGQTDVDWTLLTYYRYERIVEDIALYSQELLLKPTKGKNRFEMYKQFTDMFAPNGVIDMALETDKRVIE